jgi:hypothetical protein
MVPTAMECRWSPVSQSVKAGSLLLKLIFVLCTLREHQNWNGKIKSPTNHEWAFLSSILQSTYSLLTKHLVGL